LEESGKEKPALLTKELLGPIVESMARWGELDGALLRLSQAMADHVRGVRKCGCCVRETGGDAISANWFGSQSITRAADPEFQGFLRDATASLGVHERLLDNGSVLMAVCRETKNGDAAAVIIEAASSVTHRRQQYIDLLEYVVGLMCTAVYTLSIAEEEMQQKALIRLRQMRHEMVAALSHEMRTPLAGIKGYVTTLLRQDVDWDKDTRREFLQVISEESDRLEELVSSILDMTALEMGNIPMEKQPVLMPRLIKNLVDRLSVRSKKHRFVMDFPPHFPVVEADPHRIEQVLYNLIDNAMKYSPDGGLIVIAGKTRPDSVVVSVSDQGKGISLEHMDRLFEKYFRIGSQKHVRGIGLGLPIARQIVERHGGTIWAESVLGEGTTMYFTLPFDQVEREG
jgi:K+-sensing histidine kinase KdpD